MSKIPSNIIEAFSQRAITAGQAVEKLENWVRGMQVAAVEEALEDIDTLLKRAADLNEKAAEKAMGTELAAVHTGAVGAYLFASTCVLTSNVTEIIDRANEKLRAKVK